MAKTDDVARIEYVKSRILIIRGEKIILDSHLAELFGVATRVLNQAVKRNRARFPEDFVFQLSWDEVDALRSQIVTLNTGRSRRSRSQTATLKRGRNIKYRPHAFTEHGAIMAANVLNSPKAIEASVYVVRAFIRLRRMLTTHKELARKLTELERRLDKHDGSILELMTAIRTLMEPPAEKRERIGFTPAAKKKAQGTTRARSRAKTGSRSRKR